MIEKLVHSLNIESKTLLLAGDFTRFLLLNKMNEKSIDNFLDLLTKKVETLIIPTYNWDFCEGKTFDIKNTPSQVGILGNIALKRDDFQRSKHPIYSFAIWGKDQKELIEINNVESFEKNSIFGYLHQNKAQMSIFDKSIQNSFTFVHYVEYMNKEFINYRFIKFFEANYINANNLTMKKQYSMFVRDLKYQTYLEELEEIFVKNDIMNIQNIDSIVIRNLDLDKAYTFLQYDIKNNAAKHIHKSV